MLCAPYAPTNTAGGEIVWKLGLQNTSDYLLEKLLEWYGPPTNTAGGEIFWNYAFKTLQIDY